MPAPILVLDTNVVISAILFGGKPRDVLAYAIAGQVRLAMSRPLLDELIGVLEGKKFRFPPEATQTLADELVGMSLVVHPRQRLRVIRRDPADNRVLECAVTAGAQAVVTGDDDLLRLGAFRGVPICTPDQWLRAFRGSLFKTPGRG